MQTLSINLSDIQRQFPRSAAYDRGWENTPHMKVELADSIPAGWQHWLVWLELCREKGARSDEREAELLRLDAGRNLGFARLVGRKETG